MTCEDSTWPFGTYTNLASNIRICVVRNSIAEPDTLEIGAYQDEPGMTPRDDPGSGTGITLTGRGVLDL